jgi:glycosyltransferase involved in cell wall biosynthesis
MIKKKILFVYTVMGLGGAPRRVLLFAKILKEAGWQVSVAARDGGLKEEIEDNNIEFIDLGSFHVAKNLFLKLVLYIKSFFLINNIIKKNNINIIHNVSRYTSILCYLVSKLRNISFYSSAHARFEGYKFLGNWSWGSKVLAVSYATRDHLTNYFKVDDSKISVIQNSIIPMQRYTTDELDFFRKNISIEVKKNVLCCIGQLRSLKGQSFLLEAFNELVKFNNQTTLLIVGYGKSENDLREYVTVNKLEHYIHFLPGNIDIAKVIGISDFSILTSKREGLPTVVLESFSLGKPVIATNILGTNEIAKHNYNSLLVEYGDVIGLKEALLKLITDNNLRKKLGENARKTYEYDFNYENYKKKILNFFEKDI